MAVTGGHVRIPTALVFAVVLVTSACAAKTHDYIGAGGANRLTGATVTFTSLQDGKDTDSAVTVQLLRGSNELVAEARTVGTKFDDHSTAPPLALSVEGPLSDADARDALLRLQLAPDGRDTWTFNVRVTLSFSNNNQQSFAWTDVRLDEKSPQRTLTLSGARL
jgi:hypothetical protein